MNIGLFPMSGIRVCDTELLRLGLTLPGFVERSKTIASLPSLGLLTLAGMTPSRHRVQYVEVPDGPLLDPLPSGLDLAAISTYSAQVDEAYELAQRFRAIGVPSVIGGPHVTALPEEAAEHCDAVVVGEGEPLWLEVLQDAERGHLQKCYRADDNGYDLAAAPTRRCATSSTAAGRSARLADHDPTHARAESSFQSVSSNIGGSSIRCLPSITSAINSADVSIF